MGAKDRKKQRWMTAVEDIAVKLNPDVRGVIDWDTATYLFNVGKTTQEAGERLAQLKR